MNRYYIKPTDDDKTWLKPVFKISRDARRGQLMSRETIVVLDKFKVNDESVRYNFILEGKMYQAVFTYKEIETYFEKLPLLDDWKK